MKFMRSWWLSATNKMAIASARRRYAPHPHRLVAMATFQFDSARICAVTARQDFAEALAQWKSTHGA